MSNSTTIVADLKSVATNGPSVVTTANAIAATALSSTGGSGNFTGGTGKYAAGTYYGGMMDYLGMVQLAILKAQELGVLVSKILVNTDQSTDSTNQTLLVNVLNDLQ